MRWGAVSKQARENIDEQQDVRAVKLIASLTLLAGPALAQVRGSTGEHHCEADNSRFRQDRTALEAQCLRKLGGLASRDRDVLRLTLAEGGGTKEFRDEIQACEHNVEKCLTYRLAAYYPVQQLFVLERTGYESYDVVIVNRNSGAITKMDDHPHLSPDGKRMIAVAAFEAWTVENDIAIYAIEKERLTLEAGYKAQGYEMWAFVGWDGADRISLTVDLWIETNGNRKFVTQTAEANHTKSGWEITRDPTR